MSKTRLAQLEERVLELEHLVLELSRVIEGGDLSEGVPVRTWHRLAVIDQRLKNTEEEAE